MENKYIHSWQFLQITDSPRFGIEVVGAVAQVFYKAKRLAVIRHQHKAVRRVVRQLKRFPVQLAQSLFQSQLRTGEVHLPCG